MKRVVILQELLAQYRIGFYERLRAALAEQDVLLDLVHGAAHGARALRHDEAGLEWAQRVESWRPSIPGRPIYLKAWKQTVGADLVIVEHANRQLINYPLLAANSVGARRVAFWGHGANLQAQNPHGLAERFKRRTARMPHWWFAYTEGSADRVAAQGFPRARITVVNNSIETAEYRTSSEVRVPCSAVYIGGLDPLKRIGFLLDVGRRLARDVPGFTLTVAGDGPLRAMVESAAAGSTWLSYQGPVFGEDKARLVRNAELMLMPGMVGLAAVDSFAAGTPIVTASSSAHSPEFEYLVDGRNAVIEQAGSSEEFARAVCALLADSQRLQHLRIGCTESASVYTVDSMVRRFVEGVTDALDADAPGEAKGHRGGRSI